MKTSPPISVILAWSSRSFAIDSFATAETQSEWRSWFIWISLFFFPTHHLINLFLQIEYTEQFSQIRHLSRFSDQAEETIVYNCDNHDLSDSSISFEDFTEREISIHGAHRRTRVEVISNTCTVSLPHLSKWPVCNKSKEGNNRPAPSSINLKSLVHKHLHSWKHGYSGKSKCVNRCQGRLTL